MVYDCTEFLNGTRRGAQHPPSTWRERFSFAKGNPRVGYRSSTAANSMSHMVQLSSSSDHTRPTSDGGVSWLKTKYTRRAHRSLGSPLAVVLQIGAPGKPVLIGSMSEH